MQATAIAQPNIALIKYWGKRDTTRNLPAVGSLSITLDTLQTEMQVAFDPRLDRDELSVNGELRDAMLPRVSRCLDAVAGADRLAARVVSKSNFPIAAGLASSASSFAALCVAATEALGLCNDQRRLASLAGAASGSAARSLYSGFVELSNVGDDVRCETLCEPADWPLAVVVAVTATGPKPIGSTEAMEISRRTSPFYERWVTDQPADLEIARQAVAARDFAALGQIAEHNCLKMHSVMWSSRPPAVFWNAATMRCMESVRELRRSGQPVFFTIDAGPQVKAVCEASAVHDVQACLADVDGVVATMTTGLGCGARLGTL